MRLVRLVIASACALFLHGSMAFAQPYPSRIIKLVVPYPAGGAVDITGRLLAGAALIAVAMAATLAQAQETLRLPIATDFDSFDPDNAFEMDGLAATRAIRAEGGRFAALPIIALTANAFPEDVRICREAGMSDFLAKPLRKPALVAALLRALDGHVMAEEARLQPELMPDEVEWTDDERQMTGV